MIYLLLQVRQIIFVIDTEKIIAPSGYTQDKPAGAPVVALPTT